MSNLLYLTYQLKRKENKFIGVNFLTVLVNIKQKRFDKNSCS